jgi:hypothetical protein
VQRDLACNVELSDYRTRILNTMLKQSLEDATQLEFAITIMPVADEL